MEDYSSTMPVELHPFLILLLVTVQLGLSVQQRSGWATAAVGGNRCGEIGQNVETLKIAGFGDGQQSRCGQFALGAAVAEADLAPLHPGAQGSFHAVVGGLYALVFQESKEPVVMLEKRRGEIADLAVRAVQMPLRQRGNPFLNRDGS
jgi:hypothetical protein